MQLTQFSDIGLRVLLYLTHRPGQGPPARIDQIAEVFSIPRNHLVKVVNRLVHLGWVTSLRGRNGGLRLAPDAERLTLGTILKALEQKDSLIDCAGLSCPLTGGCNLKGALDHALRSFYETLEGYTLGMLAGGRTGARIIELHRALLRSEAE